MRLRMTSTPGVAQSSSVTRLSTLASDSTRPLFGACGMSVCPAQFSAGVLAFRARIGGLLEEPKRRRRADQVEQRLTGGLVGLVPEKKDRRRDVLACFRDLLLCHVATSATFRRVTGYLRNTRHSSGVQWIRPQKSPPRRSAERARSQAADESDESAISSTMSSSKRSRRSSPSRR